MQFNKGDPTANSEVGGHLLGDGGGFQDRLSMRPGGSGSNTRSWRKSVREVRSAKSVYWALNARSLDDVAQVNYDALRTSISTCLDNTQEKDIHLTFDQEDDFVVLKLTLKECVESEDDLISKSFLNQVNRAFPESGIFDLVVTRGYRAHSVTIYYRFLLDRDFVFDEARRKALNSAFMRIFGDRGYKKVAINIFSAGNEGQVRVIFDLASQNESSVMQSLMSRSFIDELTRKVREDRLMLLRITEASTKPMEFVQKRTHGKVTVCYALNTALRSTNNSTESLVRQCMSECLQNVKPADVSLYFTDLTEWTEMKVIVDNLNSNNVNQIETNMLSQSFIYQLNQVLIKRGLRQYTVSRSYLEVDRENVLRNYRASKTTTTKMIDQGNSGKRFSAVNDVQTKDYASYDYHKMKEDVRKDDDNECCMYCYFCFAFFFWLLPFLICALLLKEVYDLRTEVDDLKNNVQLVEWQSANAIDTSRLAWVWINGSMSCCGDSGWSGEGSGPSSPGPGSGDGHGRGGGDEIDSTFFVTTTTTTTTYTPTLMPTRISGTGGSNEITAVIDAIGSDITSVSGQVSALDGSVDAESTEEGANSQSIGTMKVRLDALYKQFDAYGNQIVVLSKQAEQFQQFLNGWSVSVSRNFDSFGAMVGAVHANQKNIATNLHEITALQASIQGSSIDALNQCKEVQEQHTAQIQELQQSIDALTGGRTDRSQSKVVIYGSKQWHNGDSEVHCPTEEYVATSCFVDFKGDRANFILWSQPSSTGFPGCKCGCKALNGGTCATSATCKVQCIQLFNAGFQMLEV